MTIMLSRFRPAVCPCRRWRASSAAASGSCVGPMDVHVGSPSPTSFGGDARAITAGACSGGPSGGSVALSCARARRFAAPARPHGRRGPPWRRPASAATCVGADPASAAGSSGPVACAEHRLGDDEPGRGRAEERRHAGQLRRLPEVQRHTCEECRPDDQLAGGESPPSSRSPQSDGGARQEHDHAAELRRRAKEDRGAHP